MLVLLLLLVLLQLLLVLLVKCCTLEALVGFGWMFDVEEED